MADNDDYFPRGGKKPTTKFFKQSSNFLGAPEKAEKKKRKVKKKVEEDDGYLTEDETATSNEKSYGNCGVWLKYSMVKEGFLALGRVNNVQDTRVFVSLPCRLSGVVMACHVSEAYNKLLESYVNDKISKVTDLQQMFRPGQYVALKVLEAADNYLMMSMMPQHVNSGRSQTDLHKGALFQAAVASLEDHGYVMDIGIPNIRAFLPKNAANPDIELDVGMVTWCSVKSVAPSPESSSVVTLSNALPALQRAFQKGAAGALAPATAVDFTVDKPLDNGVEGHIFEDRIAYIQRQHVDKINGKKPTLGQRIRARVLYVLPTANTPFLTMKNIFLTTFPDMQQEQRLKEGDIVEDAQVIKVEGRTVYLRLGAAGAGALCVRRVRAHEELSDEDVVATSYPLGSAHRVRVICYNLCDFIYSVTDERAALEERYFSLSQLAPGQLVDAAVDSLDHGGVVLRVGRCTGYVPQTHVTDAGVFVDPKKATNSQLSKKKFKVGQAVTARVLSVDPERRKLFLTLKPSLLAPELEPLASYEQARVGASCTGVVVHVKDYVLVSFFNEVQAYVPPRYVSTEPVPSAADIYHLGQIVNCTILRVDPENKKLCASLTTAPFTPSEDRMKSRKRKTSYDDIVTSTTDDDSSTKKGKRLAAAEQNTETDTLGASKKKKRKKDAEENPDNTEPVTKESKKKKKTELTALDKDSKDIDEVDNSNSKGKHKNKSSAESEVAGSGKKEKAPKKADEEITEIQQSTEESDAIETDYHEDSDHVLTPDDLRLIDMSDCETLKQYKKRVISLLKSIRARTNRIDRIDSKIVNIEAKGLTPKNKKFHTAMHMEKWVIQKRMGKLLAALQVAQSKLEELGYEQPYTDNTNKDKKKKTDLQADELTNEEANESNNSEEAVNEHSKKRSKKRKNNKKNLPADEEVENEEDDDKNSDQVVNSVSKKHSKVQKKQSKRKCEDAKVVEELKPALDVPSAKDFWSTETEPETNNAQETESSGSEDEREPEKKKKRKKLSGAEKEARALEAERRTRAAERAAAAAAAGAPASADQFERALLASPAASQLWIAYMAFHLQATEVEKARAVARRALAALPYREERERLNVWLALLGLEHRFGTEETQESTLAEALRANDPYEVHSGLLDIVAETGGARALGELAARVAKRYRGVDACARAAAACYRAGLLQRARDIMQRALVTLEPSEHVPLLVQFAQLERRAGERERAEALFERVLAARPRRVDVCAQYADMLAAAGDLARLRELMERMTSLKLPARKMKVLFKKWIELEQKIGDSAQVESIRQRATEFIEKATS